MHIILKHLLYIFSSIFLVIFRNNKFIFIDKYNLGGINNNTLLLCKNRIKMININIEIIEQTQSR
jgi:hypothetical protein